jgi:hypothetical protein
MNKQDIYLLGKDYFSVIEAAHYCCCSVSQFKKLAPKNGVHAAKRFNEVVYRRADCRAHMENAFRVT